MACLKVIKDPYLIKSALHNVINYVLGKAVCTGSVCVDIEYAAEAMELVQIIFNKNDGKQLWHFVLSFSSDEPENHYPPSALQYLAYDICSYFTNDYQIIFGIHDGDNKHIHFVVNAISFRNGKRFRDSNGKLYGFRAFVEQQVGSHVYLAFD